MENTHSGVNKQLRAPTVIPTALRTTCHTGKRKFSSHYTSTDHWYPYNCTQWLKWNCWAALVETVTTATADAFPVLQVGMPTGPMPHEPTW